jgi:dTDP-4-dehydrorhamnose reductase
MSKKKNILVVGANGLLGTAFRTEMQGCDNYYFGVRKYTDIKGLVSPQPDSFWKSEAKRPFCSVMSKESFKRIFGITSPSWMELLKECIEEYQHIKNMNK